MPQLTGWQFVASLAIVCPTLLIMAGLVLAEVRRRHEVRTGTRALTPPRATAEDVRK